METSFGFLSGSSIGYFTAKLFSGAQAGESGLISSLIFNIGNWQLHLHHWLIAFCFLLFLFFFVRRKYKLSSLFLAFTFGVFIGLMVQGILTYDDWYKILIKKL